MTEQPRPAVRLRRTLGTFLAWGWQYGALSALLLVIVFGAIIGRGGSINAIGVLALSPPVVMTVVWMSGRTTIDGDELRTGSRFRPKTYRRHEFEAVVRHAMALGRWGTTGLALQPVGENRLIDLRYSGGLGADRLAEWEEALWRWVADGEGAASQPPLFALAADDPMLLTFGSQTEAERYAEPWDVNDDLWTFWDSNGCLLRPAGNLDETHGRTHLVTTGELDVTRFRVLLIDAMEIPVPSMGRFTEMSTIELAHNAAAHLRGSRDVRTDGPLPSFRDPRL